MQDQFDELKKLARGIRDELRRFRRRLALRVKVRSRPLRIVLGSSGVPVPGWLLTDMDQLNIVVKKDWERYFQPDSVDAILAEHVLEHLTITEAKRVAELCFTYLRPGGRLRIAVPDGLHPDPDYVEAVKPMGSGEGAEDHKVLYSWKGLEALLDSVGLITHPLEYFDDDGNFVAVEWDPADGMVRRSARFDSRNHDGILRYTSIIFDAVKPQA